MPIQHAKSRIDLLEQIRDSGEPYPIEKLLKAGFPRSAVYPAYWYSSSPGSRMAFQLGCKVVYSRKLMSISLVPLDAAGLDLQQIRLDRQKKKAAERTKLLLQHLRDYADETDADVDVNSET